MSVIGIYFHAYNIFLCLKYFFKSAEVFFSIQWHRKISQQNPFSKMTLINESLHKEKIEQKES